MNSPAPAGKRPAPRSRLKQTLALLAALSLIALLTFGLLTSATTTAIDDNLAEGRSTAAPGFALELLALGEAGGGLRGPVRDALGDERVELSELRGTPIVLNFWASWCVPCREEAAVLEAGWQRDRTRGVLYLGLDMQDLSEDALAFLEEFGITYPNVREPGNEVARSYGATGIPETFFISATGRVVGHVIGVVSPQQLRAGADAARSGRVTPVLEGGDIRPQR